MIILPIWISLAFIATVKSQILTISPSEVLLGEKVTLTCRGGRYDTIQWIKKQAHNSAVMFGYKGTIIHINDDYSSRITTKVENTDDSTLVDYVYTIDAAEYRDSGEYACTRDSVAADQREYKSLVVVQPIEKVEIYAQKTGGDGLDDNAVTIGNDRDFIVTENDKYYIVCQSYSSNPKPNMTLTFADEDITDLFTVYPSMTQIPSDNRDALSNLTFSLLGIGNKALEVTRGTSRKRLTCSATVPLFDPVSVSVRIILETAPVTKCMPQTALMGQKNVKMTCTVDAAPEPGVNIKFRDNGQSIIVTPVAPHGKYSVSFKEGKDAGLWEIAFSIRDVGDKDFRTYEVLTYNDHGNHTTTMTLIKEEAVVGRGSTTLFSSMLFMIATTLLLSYL